MEIDFEKCVKAGVEQAMRECELTIGMTLKEAVERQVAKKPTAHKVDVDAIKIGNANWKNGNIKIHRSCVDSIAEFGLYRWDDKATADTVIKENDHAMDDIRYFANTIMKNKVRKESAYTPIFM